MTRDTAQVRAARRSRPLWGGAVVVGCLGLALAACGAPPRRPVRVAGGPPPDAPVSSDTVCDGAASCFAVGWRLAFEAEPADLAGAQIAFVHACGLGHADGCAGLGQVTLLQKGENASAAAATHFEQACRLKSAVGCRYLAEVYRVGEDRPRDLALAAILLRQACDLGDSDGCQLLGQMYYLGQGMPVDYTRSAELWSELCHRGVDTSCGLVGRLYEHGWGVVQDLDLARQYYERACQAGEVLACEDLDRLSEAQP